MALGENVLSAVIILLVGGSANNGLSIITCHHFHENAYSGKVPEIYITLILLVMIGLRVHEVEAIVHK
jgi:hypothetical protein